MNEVRLLFAGDFCAHGRCEPLVKQLDIEALFGSIRKEIEASDLAIVDLEAPLVLGGTKRPKTGPHLMADPMSAKVLAEAGVGLVAMANNHIMDYGDAGLAETMSTCHKAGLATTGVGSTLAEARIPYSSTINGRTVAIVNVAENEWSNTHGNVPGANPVDPVMNAEDVRRAKSTHDTVVVVYHGGNEHYQLPSPRLKSLFRFYADAGASAVIAHHTHVVSGFEVHNGVPIFYGLGNLLFDWPGKRNDQWNLGIAVRLIVSEKVAFDIIPFRQCDSEPGIRVLEGAEKDSVLSHISQLNSVIADDTRLELEFKRYCDEKSMIYNLYLEPYQSRVMLFLRKRGLLPGFFSSAKRRLYLNIIRCEAHRDVLLHALKK